jgi:hypothetical protein
MTLVHYFPPFFNNSLGMGYKLWHGTYPPNVATKRRCASLNLFGRNSDHVLHSYKPLALDFCFVVGKKPKAVGFTKTMARAQCRSDRRHPKKAQSQRVFMICKTLHQFFFLFFIIMLIEGSSIMGQKGKKMGDIPKIGMFFGA